MDTHLLDLKHIIDIDRFQLIQDELADLTKLAIITVDYRGIPITQHSSRSQFCSIVRNTPATFKKCIKCDSRGGLESARLKSPYIYRCHCGIVDFAIPIIVQDKYLGAVMAGQVRASNPKALECIIDDAEMTSARQINSELYEILPVMDIDVIQKNAMTIFNIVNYIVEESIIKNSLYDINQKLMQFFEIETLYLADGTERKIYSMQNRNIEEIHTYLMDVTHGGSVSLERQANSNFVAHKILRPALEYIEANLANKINISGLAMIAHVSDSYFSKLFNREMGCSVPEYITNRKIAKAKEWLERDDKSVSQIALDLGFTESGYFIKTFKQDVGITPFAYKKLNIKSDRATDA